MAKNKPVRICVIKHKPKIDPKFHHAEILIGAGRSTKALLAILIRGCVFRILIITIIICYTEKGFIVINCFITYFYSKIKFLMGALNLLEIFTTTINVKRR
jgi:hypothetical protein